MLKYIYYYFCIIKYNLKILFKKKYKHNKLLGEILRNVHSIEKGLSITNPRPGFGVKKVKELINLIESYIELNGNEEVIQYAVSSIKAYLEYQNSINFDSDDIHFINSKYNQLQHYIEYSDMKAGVETYVKNDIEVESIERFFNSRHSVRRFTKEPVPEELIKKAIKLAQRAPSACNRQAVRVYNISSKSYMEHMGDLSGIGGFAQEVDRFLLITSVQTEYRPAEINQHIVSASIFAGYLSLSLHAYGIGACVVQRSLIPSKLINEFKQSFNIPQDEQIVLMIGIGMTDEEVIVPVSHRLSIDSIYKNLD